jgi:hypothetical protein
VTVAPPSLSSFDLPEPQQSPRFDRLDQALELGESLLEALGGEARRVVIDALERGEDRSEHVFDGRGTGLTCQ